MSSSIVNSAVHHPHYKERDENGVVITRHGGGPGGLNNHHGVGSIHGNRANPGWAVELEKIYTKRMQSKYRCTGKTNWLESVVLATVGGPPPSQYLASTVGPVPHRSWKINLVQGNGTDWDGQRPSKSQPNRTSPNLKGHMQQQQNLDMKLHTHNGMRHRYPAGTLWAKDAALGLTIAGTAASDERILTLESTYGRVRGDERVMRNMPVWGQEGQGLERKVERVANREPLPGHPRNFREVLQQSDRNPSVNTLSLQPSTFHRHATPRTSISLRPVKSTTRLVSRTEHPIHTNAHPNKRFSSNTEWGRDTKVLVQAEAGTASYLPEKDRLLKSTTAGLLAR
ncbi:hypothetical protein HK102_009346 [Quaeritorhiza haematococci]|nr:hypothetical protein HK102_009346 [Quaeritorhiza haematococci]